MLHLKMVNHIQKLLTGNYLNGDRLGEKGKVTGQLMIVYTQLANMIPLNGKRNKKNGIKTIIMMILVIQTITNNQMIQAT